jgi:hypothetical protein
MGTKNVQSRPKMDILSLYQQLGRIEVQHTALVHVLGYYSDPNKKIHELVKSGDLISLSKGFYLLSPERLQKSYTPEVIANLLYGPSYVSLERALSYHGLIPESVSVVTSVTTQRAKERPTPVGLFTYEHLPLKKYVVGVKRYQLGEQNRFLMATPTKALLDYVTFRWDRISRERSLTTRDKVEEFLTEDLRFNCGRYKELTAREDLSEIRKPYLRSPGHMRVLDFLWTI